MVSEKLEVAEILLVFGTYVYGKNFDLDGDWGQTYRHYDWIMRSIIWVRGIKADNSFL